MIYLKQSFEANLCKPIIHNEILLQRHNGIIYYIIHKIINRPCLYKIKCFMYGRPEKNSPGTEGSLHVKRPRSNLVIKVNFRGSFEIDSKTGLLIAEL